MKKKIKKKSFFGGVVKANNDSLNNFQTILLMLGYEQCVVTCVSYASTRGFIFKLHLPGVIHFKGFNQTTKIFDVDIDTLIMKIVLVSETDQHFNDFKDLTEKIYDKYTEKIDDVKREVVTQSEIYSITLNKGEPLCPAIVDFSLVQNDLLFLQQFRNKCLNDIAALYMVNYLIGKINLGGIRLGIITMESALEYETYGNTIKHYLAADAFYTEYFNINNKMLNELFISVNFLKNMIGPEIEKEIKNRITHTKKNILEKHGELKKTANSLAQAYSTPILEFQGINNNIIIKWLLIYLSTGFIHCDLNGGNILIKGNVHNMQIKIIDFGIGFKPSGMVDVAKSKQLVKYAENFSYGLLTDGLKEQYFYGNPATNFTNADSVLKLIIGVMCLEKSYLTVTFDESVSSKILFFYWEESIRYDWQKFARELTAFLNLPDLGIKYKYLTMSDNFEKVIGGNYSKTIKKKKKKIKKRKTKQNKKGI